MAPYPSIVSQSYLGPHLVFDVWKLSENAAIDHGEYIAFEYICNAGRTSVPSPLIHKCWASWVANHPNDAIIY
jgi:hypothetical protein